MSTPNPQAGQPPAERPGWFQRWLDHRVHLAALKNARAIIKAETKQEARKADRKARDEARAARQQQPSLLHRAWSAWNRQRQTGQHTVQRQSLRHVIQAAGHEYLALILMVAAAGGSLLFFLGRYYGSTAPLYIVIPAAALLALSIEWSTAVFGQDMQDSLTLHQPAMFLVNLIKALVAYSVSTFMLANAASAVWAPLDNLLGMDTHTWAWALAVTVFGVQFLLKLSPERPKAAKNIVAVSHFVAMMAPDASPEDQIAMAARMLAAFAGQEMQAPTMPPARQAPTLTAQRNHHQVIVPSDPLVPVMLSSDAESEAGADDSPFRLC